MKLLSAADEEETIGAGSQPYRMKIAKPKSLAPAIQKKSIKALKTLSQGMAKAEAVRRGSKK